MRAACCSGRLRFVFCFAVAFASWHSPFVARELAAADVAELADLPCRILFEAYGDQNWDIWSIRPDGSDRRNVTQTADQHELYPQASPDGSKICFLLDQPSGRDTLRSLWVMNVDGSERKRIAEQARHPCWSPDGKKIAFSKQEFAKFPIKDFATKRLYIHDLESGETAVHPNDKIEHIYVPTWSADGKWIVATVHAGMGFGHAIVALEVDGERVVDLAIEGCRPCLSRDGGRITWSRDDHTVCVAEVAWSADGPKLANERVVYHHATQHLYHPDFSPDAQLVSFSMGPGGRVPAVGPGTHTEVAEMVGVCGPWDIYIQRVDHEGEPRRVTHDEKLSNKESEWICTP
jgi:Tol biopolymer transport system component